jgi:hypothetical protein
MNRHRTMKMQVLLLTATGTKHGTWLGYLPFPRRSLTPAPMEPQTSKITQLFVIVYGDIF